VHGSLLSSFSSSIAFPFALPEDRPLRVILTDRPPGGKPWQGGSIGVLHFLPSSIDNGAPAEQNISIVQWMVRGVSEESVA
jgi:hypothetical protein